jgi:hypothetical protein
MLKQMKAEAEVKASDVRTGCGYSLSFALTSTLTSS